MQVNPTFDASGVIGPAVQFANSLGIARTSVEDFVVSQVKFNKTAKGTEYTAMVKAIVEGSRELTIALKNVGGQWKATGGTVQDAAAKIEAANKKLATPPTTKSATDLIKQAALAYGVLEQSISNLNITQGKIRTVDGKIVSTEIRAQVSATKELVLQVQKLGNEYKIVASQMRNIPNLPTRRSLGIGSFGDTPGGGGGKRPGGGGGDGDGNGFLNFDAATVASVFLFKQALSAITQEIRTAASEAREFAISISQIRTLSQDSQATFLDWNNTLMQVSDNLGLPIIDVAKAAYESLSNQVTKGADDTKRFITTVGEFARVTVSTLEESTNLFSSVINGYGISLERTDEIAAKLFKTIDLGRVKASDLANSLGRITPLASSLGISLEETLGSIAILTRQGVMPQNALTFFLNLMQKLVQPTEEMKALLESWGTPTAEAAIATFGFVGVLTKLQTASKGSATEIGKLFNEIRGKQGFTGLTNSGNFDQYVDGIKQITDAEQDYVNAKKIRAESSADVINKELNRTHNFFVQLGESLTEILAVFNNRIGSISGTIRVLVNGVWIAVAAFGVWKTATLAYAAASAIFQRVMQAEIVTVAANTAVKEANIVASTRFGRIIAAVGGPGGAIAIFGLAVAGMIELLRDSKKEIEGLSESTQRLQDRMQRRAITKTRNQFGNELGNLKTNLTGGYQVRLNEIASGIIVVKQELENLKPIGEEVNNSLAGSFKNYIDSLTRGISEYKRKIDEARNGIRNSSREILDFQQTLDEKIRGFQMKYANDFQKGQLREQNISRLRQEAKALYSTGTTEDQKLADQKLKQALDIVEEQQTSIQEWRKQQLEQSIKDGTTPREYNTITVDSNELTRRGNELIEDQRRGHERVNELRRQAIVDNTKLVDQEENRKKQIEGIAKELNDLKLDDVRFKDPTTGKFSQERFDKFRGNLVRQVSELSGKGGSDDPEIMRNQRENLGLYIGDLERQLKFLQEEEAVRKRINDLIERQNSIQKEQREIIKRYEENQSTRAKSLETIAGNKGRLTDVVGTIDVLQNKANSFLAGNEGVFSKSSQKANGERKGLVADLENMRNSIKTTVAEFRAKPPELISQKDIEQLKSMGVRYFKTYEELLLKYNSAIKEAGPNAVQLLGPDADNAARTFGDFKNNFIDIIREAEDAFKQLSTARKQNEQIDAFGQLSQDFEDVNSALVKANEGIFTAIGVPFNKVQGTVEQINIQLDIMARKIQAMPRADFSVSGDNLSSPAPNFGGGGDFSQNYASGGIAALHPGRPKGMDTIAAWLAPGEYIMPVDKTQRFKPQLDAMRAGLNPRYYNHGGYVTTTIGDVHVTVSGSDTEQKSVRKIGKELQRQVRRGQLRLE